MSTLTSSQKSTIKNSPKTARVLAEKYGVSMSTIYKLKNSETVKSPGRSTSKKAEPTRSKKVNA